MSNVVTLNERRPTGKPPWPLIMLEGPEKSGKTYSALALSADERITKTWALDLGEGSLDEYGVIPGADFWVLGHDGTWRAIIGQLDAVTTAAEQVAADGGVPMLVVDSGTAEWDMLKAWVDTRARRQDSNRRKLAQDPDAEIKASRNLWNDADSRHNRFMNLLRRFPGPVIVTARGKWVSATGKDGQPIPGEKEYRVEGQKNLGYAANAWVRLSRDARPSVVGLRHVRWGVRPGIDEPQTPDEFSLAWLIFDLIGCEPGATAKRDQADLDADQTMPDEALAADETTPTRRGGAAPADLGQRAQTGAAAILAATSAEQAVQLAITARDSIAAAVDVLDLVPAEVRETLGVDQPGLVVTLAELGAKVSAYWTRHGCSPTAARDGSGQDGRAAA